MKKQLIVHLCCYTARIITPRGPFAKQCRFLGFVLFFALTMNKNDSQMNISVFILSELEPCLRLYH